MKKPANRYRFSSLEPLPRPLEEAFQSAWTILKSSDWTDRAVMQEQVRSEVKRCIVELAANGITDPKELRRQAVERIVLWRALEGVSSGPSTCLP
jgi:hypothetical protein